MKNTTENNKLIAEFLGEIKQPFEFPQFGYINSMGDWKDTFFDNQLKFHSDWNWLMRVVEKIESLGYTVTIAGVMCKVTKVLDLENSIVSYVLGDKSRKLELIYTTMVEFVKWHNKN